MLGTDTNSDHSSSNSLNAGNTGDRLKQPWRLYRATHLEDLCDACVREDLNLLRDTCWEFSSALDQMEYGIDRSTPAQVRSENAGGCDGVLNGEIDADAAGW